MVLLTIALIRNECFVLPGMTSVIRFSEGRWGTAVDAVTSLR